MRKLAALCLVFVASPLLAQDFSPWHGAKWVWDEADANTVAQNNEPRYLRLPFTLPAKASKAELWITVDNHYVAYVNGAKVGEDAEWNSVEKYDVAKLLVPGKNVLAIKATNQGGVAGAIARLHVRTDKDLFIVTDERTRITQKAPKDWTAVGFDDSSWFAAVVLGDPTIGPWNIAGSAVAAAGKGPKAYGSSAVDPKVKTRLTAAEQLKHFIVPKDFEIELVAADPVVINPITMVLDDKGRIIVSESHTYRYGPPGSPIKPFANPVIRLDPDGKGGFTRTLVADGFADPVMGIAVKGDKIWLTACDFLYQYDLLETAPKERKKGEGVAVNRRTLLTDKNHAWNPFGMFVLEWGPDGKLYMSVGNHSINIEGPPDSPSPSGRGKGEGERARISARGSSGMVMRMNPDGTKMERLVHGLRVPYSFEYDPFGQLWLLSNGEGNPDRFVRVIEGVDYHCYSRGAVDNNWLAGNHPLAPPCEEVHGGAHTQFMRYYGAAYPAEYQGALFACNWGRHGFAGPNRGIFRFVLDDRNNIVKKDTLVACTDPHFRPSHIYLDTDGSLLIADWYGRDDESDMTGRIWRLKYVGKDRPVVTHKLDAPEWKTDEYAISALGSPSHVIRDKAMAELVRRGLSPRSAITLGNTARSSKDPLAAANALWTLLRTGDSGQSIREGVFNPDWRVRKLAVNLLRRHFPKGRDILNVEEHVTWNEKDPAVRLEAAISASSRTGVGELLAVALEMGADADPHLRYEAAWHVAKNGNEGRFTKLLASPRADIRLAGLIAIDVACYENFPSTTAALTALAKALENPGKLDHQLLLTVAQLDGDASIVPGLEKLIARADVPLATTAKAVLVLKAKAGGLSKGLSAAAGKRLVEAVEKGTIKIATPTDQLVLFDFLESEGPTPFALKQIEGQLRSSNKELKQAAHVLARRFGPKATSLAAGLWPGVLNPKAKFEEALEALSTIARIEAVPNEPSWLKLLDHDDPFVRMEAVRWWRIFSKNATMLGALGRKAPQLTDKGQGMKDEVETVLRGAEPWPKRDKMELTTYALKDLADMPAADRPKRAAMGRQVFERNACTRCHTTATATTPVAPSLKGVAGQKAEYLVESVLYPSKIIKTGWEVEVIEFKDGRILAGLVKDDGKFLRVFTANWWMDGETKVAKADIESRTLSRTSIMPEGQEATLSRREFVDLIAYLQTLK